jgi:hypothetical protein
VVEGAAGGITMMPPELACVGAELALVRLPALLRPEDDRLHCICITRQGWHAMPTRSPIQIVRDLVHRVQGGLWMMLACLGTCEGGGKTISTWLIRKRTW